MQYDNGAPYLFVDGQCNYWVSDPSHVWNETHSGVLDANAAADFGARLHFGAWPSMAGTWTDPTGGVGDAPVLIFDDSIRAVICLDLCDHPDVPAAVKAMRDELPVITQELWQLGIPLASNVRAIAVAIEPLPGVSYVAWPLTRPISDFVRTGNNIDYGEGTLEDNPASVQALKDLRASFLRGDIGQFMNNLPVTADGVYYQLYIRDTLPFEDDRGLVPLTVEIVGP